MKLISRLTFLTAIIAVVWTTSCKEDIDDLKNCTGCTDDAPYGTVDGSSCYATKADCEASESGNCVICQ